MKNSAPTVRVFATIGEWLLAAGQPGLPVFPDFHLVPRYGFSDQRAAGALPPSSKNFFEITLLSAYQASAVAPPGTEVSRPAICFVKPGTVFSPLREKPVAGFSLYFTDHFLPFNPEELAWRFSFFAPGADPVLFLSPATFEDLRLTAEAMLLETRNSLGAALRPVLQSYLMILLHKCRVAAEHRAKQPDVQPRAIGLTTRFQQLVQLHFLTHRTVADYARMLKVTPGHLNDSVKDTIGQNAGAVIMARLLEEAKKLLAFSDADVAQIGRDLHFSNPSHFGKFFKKATGETPLGFRLKSKSVK